MKQILFIFILAVFTQPFAYSQNANIDSTINAVRVKHMPDKRTGVFEVTHRFVRDTLVLLGKTSDSALRSDLIHTLENQQQKVKSLIQVLPDNTIGEKHWSIVPLSANFIRSAPEYQAELITQATLGTPVKILEKRNGWRRIQTPDQYVGWTNTELRPIDIHELHRLNNRPRVIVTDLNAVVYEKPSIQSQRIMDVLVGNILTLESKKIAGKFTQVSFPDGTKGFIASKAVKTWEDWQQSIQLTGENVIETSKQFLGLPYLWGGTSARGFDCSGFTKSVFFQYGLILPRDASQQFYCGDEVDISNGFNNLQKGDLLFFGEKTASNPDKFNVVHVAIYAGNNRFIHSSGKVRINSLNPLDPDYDAYNHKRLIGAKRIIGCASLKEHSVFSNDWYNQR